MSNFGSLGLISGWVVPAAVEQILEVTELLSLEGLPCKCIVPQLLCITRQRRGAPDAHSHNLSHSQSMRLPNYLQSAKSN